MKKIFLLLLLITSGLGFTQTLSSELSSKVLKVGETGQFKIQISQLKNKAIRTAAKNELMPFGFEVIEDSIGQTNDDYSRLVKFRVLQPGKYTIPIVQIRVGDKVLKTIPYELTVVNSVGSGDQISDIKPNMQVKLSLSDYWSMYKNYILAILGIIILLILIFKLIKKLKRKKEIPVVATNRTLKALDSLRKKKWIEKDDYRSFYVELIDIIRSFLADRYSFPARELLSDDLVNYLKDQKMIADEDSKQISSVFERGDLTKFAKIIPTTQNMENDFLWTKDFVNRSLKTWQSENANQNE